MKKIKIEFEILEAQTSWTINYQESQLDYLSDLIALEMHQKTPQTAQRSSSLTAELGHSRQLVTTANTRKCNTHIIK